MINFNLDLPLSDKLKEHEIDYGTIGVYFNEYFVQNFYDLIFYIFPGTLGEFVFDLQPPVFYIDVANQTIYRQSSSGLGTFMKVLLFFRNFTMFKLKFIFSSMKYSKNK